MGLSFVCIIFFFLERWWVCRVIVGGNLQKYEEREREREIKRKDIFERERDRETIQIMHCTT